MNMGTNAALPGPLTSSSSSLSLVKKRQKAPSVQHGGGFEVRFPELGRLVFRSPQRFSTWNNEWVRGFIETTFSVPEVSEVEIDTFHREAIIHYGNTMSAAAILQRLSLVYREGLRPEFRPTLAPELFLAIPSHLPRLRTFRYGQIISIWELRSAKPRTIRLRNAFILGRPHLVSLLKDELLGATGIERFSVQPVTGSLTIVFEPQLIGKTGIIQLLDAALCLPETSTTKRKSDQSLAVATASLGVAAVATFVAPSLLPAGMLLMLYTASPSFRRAYQVVVHERRLGVNVLDSIIFGASLFTGQIFAGAMTAWFLNFGRKLLEQTQEESTRMLQEVFGKQASTASVLVNGVERKTPLELIHAGDLVVVHTGEAVPVDGVIESGDAILDQHTLTGESAPVEKTAGDKIFASTLLLAGSAVVKVERAGTETAAGQIKEILSRTVAYRLRAHSRGEELADKAVLPTLGLAAMAGGVGGVSSALAVVNSEMGTGIRMAAPLGLLTSITSCAQNGILVKDGRALELMSQVDTVLFDKTGTLTREKPEVCRIFACADFNEEFVLECAAAAEQKFTHPIARAILERFSKLNRPIPVFDASKYRVGYGITVELGGKIVRVGSRRFLEQEGIPIPPEIEREMRDLHEDGHSFVCVAIERQLAGVLELQTSHRPEVDEIIAGLRKRGVSHIAIISGDHEKPTRKLAEHLGVDRYFAEVLPQEKARYVELLQQEGRTVCFVGDGINDSIALKTANVSISLRGASTIATDNAQVVFMEENLSRMCDLIDISRELKRNVDRSWNLIMVPNALCVAGVFLFGFNIWHSVAINNLSAIAALLNGLLPLRRADRAREQRELEIAAAERLLMPEVP